RPGTVNLANADPLASAAVVNTKPASSPTSFSSSAATGPPPRSFPTPRSSDLTITDNNPSAGLSSGSVNPKSAAENVCEPSSATVTVVSAPAGASFTDDTFTVKVFGLWSVSTPGAPPSSRTWNVKLAYGDPFAF